MGKKRTEAVCSFCGEKKNVFVMKDGAYICDRCDTHTARGYDVEWNKLTRNDVGYLESIPIETEDFRPDFEFGGFRANSNTGLFAISNHHDLFELRSITKYYILFKYERARSEGSYLLRSARLVIELNHPVLKSISQGIARDKDSLLEILDVLDIAAKNSYKRHNAPLLDYLKAVTGLSLSASKKQKSW